MRRRTLTHLFGGGSVPASPVAQGRGALARLRDDKRGGVALMTAAAATSLLGVAGLTIEVGGWYLLRRNMQAAADAAAIAGAWHFDDKQSGANVVTFARSVASRNGFVHDPTATKNATKVDVSPPDATGRVAVTVERKSTVGLLRAVGLSDSTRTITVRAVAQVVDAGAPPCILAMHGSITFGNKPSLTASGCAVASNSSASNAIDIGSGNSTGNGPGRITAGSIITHGGCEGCAEAQKADGPHGPKLILPAGRSPLTFAPLSRNQFEDLDSWTPQPTGCQAMPAAMPLAPGCSTGIEAKNGAPVDLKPGIYYIRSGNLDVQGDLTCTACTPSAGVAIVMVGSGGGAPGKINIQSSQACIRLNASAQPLERRLDGVVIWRHNPGGTPDNTDIDLRGGADLRLDGALVAPTSGISLGGNSAAAGASTSSGKSSKSGGDQGTKPSCNQADAVADPTKLPKPVCNLFVVGSMELRGNTSLAVDGCSDYNAELGTPRIARLVE